MIVFDVLLSQAIIINDIMMRYVSGELSNPITSFDVANTTQYIDINNSRCPVTDLIEFAATDERLPFSNRNMLETLLASQYDYRPEIPPIPAPLPEVELYP